MLGERGSYQRKTEGELTTLATDILDKKVFTSDHIAPEDQDLLDHVFMPLFFMTPKAKQELEEDEMYLLYQYLTEAGPRTIQGYPTFDHIHSLDREDSIRLKTIYRQLRKERGTTEEETRAQ